MRGVQFHVPHQWVVSVVNREEMEVFIEHGARPKLKSLEKQC